MIKIIVDRVVVGFVVVVECIVDFGCSRLEIGLGIGHFVPFEGHIYNLVVLGI